MCDVDEHTINCPLVLVIDQQEEGLALVVFLAPLGIDGGEMAHSGIKKTLLLKELVVEWDLPQAWLSQWLLQVLLL